MTEIIEQIDNTEEVLNLLLDEAIENARQNFFTFVQLMAPEVLPEEFVGGRHIELICSELQAIERSVAVKTLVPKRSQFFLPPGSMKSKLGNLFCAWVLGRHPNWCFLALAADAALAIDNYGRPVKDLVDSEAYKAIFPETILKADVRSAGRWDTTKKGKFIAKGVGQSITGRRAHIAIVDDAVTEHTTIAAMKDINDWYIPGLRTRLLPRSAEIIINTRWFVNDLSGYMENVDKASPRPWNIIRIPALCNEEAKKLLWREGDPTDKYAKDTSFWPEFWPTELLLEKRATTPPQIWNALYMQNPVTEEGSIIKRRDFKIWDEDRAPMCDYVVISMDTAFSTKETADFTAYTVWGVFRHEVTLFDNATKATLPCMILLDADKGRWDLAELAVKAQELDAQYRPDFFIIEDKASGQSLIPELRKRGLPIMAYQPEKDKMFRLQATTPYFQSGRVWVQGGGKDYVEMLIDEVVTFPKAPHDDLTDTVSQAVLWLRDTLKIDNDGYTNDYDDETPVHSGKTYWSSLLTH